MRMLGCLRLFLTFPNIYTPCPISKITTSIMIAIKVDTRINVEKSSTIVLHVLSLLRSIFCSYFGSLPCTVFRFPNVFLPYTRKISKLGRKSKKSKSFWNSKKPPSLLLTQKLIYSEQYTLKGSWFMKAQAVRLDPETIRQLKELEIYTQWVHLKSYDAKIAHLIWLYKSYKNNNGDIDPHDWWSHIEV